MTRTVRAALRWPALLLTLTGLIFAALTVPAQAGNNPNVDRLRVLTYNMCAQKNPACVNEYDLAKGLGTRATLANRHVVNAADGAQRPDVILLQEVGTDVFSKARIEEIFAGYRLARRADANWILFNTKTLAYSGTGGEVKTVARTFPWAQFARVGKTANKVTVVNVHLTGDEATAKKEIRALSSALSPKLGRRTVIGGDFNARTGAPELDTFRSAFTPATGTPTDVVSQVRSTNTHHKDSIAADRKNFNPISGKAIDHIFAGTGMKRVTSAIHGDAGEGIQPDRATWWKAVSQRRSDHNAVYAELAW